jgi:hypothetical protein
MRTISQVAEGAYFVPSYSVQSLTPSYDTQTTIQSLGSDSHEIAEDFSATEIVPDAANSPSTGGSPDAPELR